MNVFVTVDLFKGLLNEIKVFGTRAAAEKAEQDWLRENDITDETGREGKAQNGTEVFVQECEVI